MVKRCYFSYFKCYVECEWFRSWELKNRLFELFFKGIVSCQLYFLGFDSFPFHYRAAQLLPIIDLFLINIYQFMHKLPISSIPQFFHHMFSTIWQSNSLSFIRIGSLKRIDSGIDSPYKRSWELHKSHFSRLAHTLRLAKQAKQSVVGPKDCCWIDE